MKGALFPCVLVAVLVNLTGCKIKPWHQDSLPSPPSEEIRAKLGKIGVLSPQLESAIVLQKPAGIGGGAAKGAGKAAFAGMQGGYLAVLLVPVGAVGGAVTGAIKGVSAGNRREAEAELRGAISEMNLERAVRDRIFERIRDNTRHPVAVVDECPSPTDGKISYRSLSGKGIDTVLEVSVEETGLAGEKGINPPVAAFLAVRTRLIRTSDDSVLYDDVWVSRVGSRKFMNWSENHAQAFREAVGRCMDGLVENAADELFLLYLPRNRSTWVYGYSDDLGTHTGRK